MQTNSTTNSSALGPGTVLGKYELLFRLASGGMATVWVARVAGEAGFQKIVALKTILPHLVEDGKFSTMFMDEARIAAHISSPYCVETLDLGRDDNTLFMAMELVVGCSLRDILRELRKRQLHLPVDVACGILWQIARGLADAHRARTPTGVALDIVHRDVSPHNALVGEDGRVKLSDFGVARAVHRLGHSNTGEVKGKMSYLAPEQLRLEPVDQRADVFALGVVAWETLATKQLFTGENSLAIAKQVAEAPIPSLHRERPEVPLLVAKVVARALRRDTSRRTPSASTVADELLAAARETVGLADETRIAEALRPLVSASVESFRTRLRDAVILKPIGSRDSGRFARSMQDNAQETQTDFLSVTTHAVPGPRPSRLRRVVLGVTALSTAAGIGAWGYSHWSDPSVVEEAAQSAGARPEQTGSAGSSLESDFPLMPPPESTPILDRDPGPDPERGTASGTREGSFMPGRRSAASRRRARGRVAMATDPEPPRIESMTEPTMDIERERAGMETQPSPGILIDYDAFERDLGSTGSR